MMTDPIADFLTQLRNGYKAEKGLVTVSYSQMKYSIASVLHKEGYIGRVEVKKESGVQKHLQIELLYTKKKPKITSIKRISKPGRRVYVKRNTMPKVLGGRGIAIISTPSGIITGSQARQKGVGGEILCEVW